MSNFGPTIVREEFRNPLAPTHSHGTGIPASLKESVYFYSMIYPSAAPTHVHFDMPLAEVSAIWADVMQWLPSSVQTATFINS